MFICGGCIITPHTRCAPLPLAGRGWGWGSRRDHLTTPTPAQRSQACAGCASLPACRSRCFASAFLALRTAVEGRLYPPHKGEGWTEFAAALISTPHEGALMTLRRHTGGLDHRSDAGNLALDQILQGGGAAVRALGRRAAELDVTF